MKSTAEFIEDVTKITYPCLLRGVSTHLIVLFTKPKTGTVVHQNDRHSLGYYSSDWDMSCFKKADVTVTLSDKA